MWGPERPGRPETVVDVSRDAETGRRRRKGVEVESEPCKRVAGETVR